MATPPALFPAGILARTLVNPPVEVSPVPIPTQPPNLVIKDVIDLEVAVEVEAVVPSCREHLINLHDHPCILQTILDPTNPAKAPSSLDIL